MKAKEAILQGKTALGIEFGSTRIKAVLTDLNSEVLAVGTYDWENKLLNGVWTYSLEEIHTGLAECYRSMKRAVEKEWDVTITRIGAMGISAMMHGYMPFNHERELLTPFRTWRNRYTQQAADVLTKRFGFNIPLRWTIAHLYQSILDQGEHVPEISYVTTLDAYLHWILSGQKVTGIGDASGMFPVDSDTCDYCADMIQSFDELIEPYGFSWKIKDILPGILRAGEPAGTLTEAGAAMIDPEGDLLPGVPMCPPEGDAGTGMVATDSVAPLTGNVSAGTSTFAMVTLEKQLSKVYRGIDMVTTPSGYPVAMAHASNGTSDLNAWVGLFGEFAKLAGCAMDPGDLYRLLYTHSLTGESDCGGLLAYGYLSGEGVAGLEEGRPLFVRTPDAGMNLANFFRCHLYTALGAVRLGMNILQKEEQISIGRIMAHGGLFKTRGVGQRYLSAALGVPVTVMSTASEGGAWGMAVLALYMIDGAAGGATLEDYLRGKIFSGKRGETITASAEEIEGYDAFVKRYQEGLDIEREAVNCLI
ncbi:MAG: ATPase [Eubacterium sp.]|nr:ATPase [Eubacterium sp.]